MESDNLISITDIYKLTALDLEGLSPRRVEWHGRLWSYFDRIPAEKILAEYESGRLVVKARDFAAAFQRVKDRIFEAERMQSNNNEDGTKGERDANKKGRPYLPKQSTK